MARAGVATGEAEEARAGAAAGAAAGVAAEAVALALANLIKCNRNKFKINYINFLPDFIAFKYR